MQRPLKSPGRSAGIFVAGLLCGLCVGAAAWVVASLPLEPSPAEPTPPEPVPANTPSPVPATTPAEPVRSPEEQAHHLMWEARQAYPKVPLAYAKEQAWQASRSLEIRILSSPGPEVFAREATAPSGIETWRGWHEHLRERFERQRSALEEEWGLSGQRLEAAYLVAVVANLLPQGAPDGAPDTAPASALALLDDDQRGQPPRLPLTHLLQAADRADCNEFASMLYMLLKLSGFEAWHVGPDDSHIHVEARLDGELAVLDAMYSFVALASAEAFYNRAPRSGAGSPSTQVYLFPNPGADPASASYRARKGQRTLFSILTASMLRTPPHRYPNWDKFEANLEHQGVVLGR